MLIYRHNVIRFFSIAAFSFSAALGCSKQQQQTGLFTEKSDQSALRPVTNAEAETDFDAMIGSIRALYGPYEYKEKRFGYSIEKEAQRIRGELKTATTEADKTAKFYEMLRLLQDGHVSLQSALREQMRIPIAVMPVENSYIVETVNPVLANYGITPGDEIVKVDGKTPFELLKVFKKYSWMGNDYSDRHFGYMIFVRESHITETFPTQPFALIEYRKPAGDGSFSGGIKLAEIPWMKRSALTSFGLRPVTDLENLELYSPNVGDVLESKALAQQSGSAGIAKMGDGTPAFWNGKIAMEFGVTKVQPDIAIASAFYRMWVTNMRAQNEVRDAKEIVIPAKFPETFAALYKYQGKTILMIRQPSYSTEDAAANLAVYSALIAQYQPIADVLVVDQTHNPGGSVSYVDSFTRLFAPQGANGFVQFLNTDRKWLTDLGSWLTSMPPDALLTSFLAQYVRAMMSGVERDQEAGLRLTKLPFSFSGMPRLAPAPGVTWNKPVLVLIDELCGSGGDAFPMAIKNNKLGVLFGARTIGMGGNVEAVLDLPTLRSKLRLTRGLFTSYRPDGQYPAESFVENNGVTPDIPFTLSVKDVRQGYVEYFSALSKAAASL